MRSQCSSSFDTSTSPRMALLIQCNFILSKEACVPKSTFTHSSLEVALIQALRKAAEGNTSVTGVPFWAKLSWVSVQCAAPAIWSSKRKPYRRDTLPFSLNANFKLRVGSSSVSVTLLGSLCALYLDATPGNESAACCATTCHFPLSSQANNLIL